MFEFSAGSDVRNGADGMAFWYTSSTLELGPVFGANNYFDGLGIFFDTYDNDGKVCVHC